MAVNFDSRLNLKDHPTPPEGYFLLNDHIPAAKDFIVEGTYLVSRNDKQTLQTIKLQEGDLVFDRSTESWNNIAYAPGTEVWGKNFYARKFIDWDEQQQQQQQQQQQSKNSINETYEVDCW